jgi:hypothetical protein
MGTLVAVRQDPRLLYQLLRRNALGLNRPQGLSGALRLNPPNAPDSLALAGPQEPEEEEQLEEREQVKDDEPESDAAHRGRHKRTEKGVDWSTSLGVNNSRLARNVYPAKFSFDINGNPDCTNDFVVFPTSVAGSATQATIIAYNKLYSTQPAVGGFCTNNGPGTKWAYRNTGGTVSSSPVLSQDGAKVAWVGGNGVVHVLTTGTTGANGTAVNAPAIPGVGNNAVLTNVTLTPGSAVTSSSLYVDYTDDVAYVGDDSGVLHKLTGIFNGVPAEVATGGWPVTVNAGVALTGPILDSVTNNIFLTDGSGRLSYVREVNSGPNGTCAAGAPPCLGSTVLVISAGTAIADSPIVDSSSGKVFTETASNGTNAVIVQADTGLNGPVLGGAVTVPVGMPDAVNPLHGGDFDNNYFNNPTSGFYYVCGKSPANRNPRLYRIGFGAGGVMNPAPGAATVVLATGRAQCSPATEVFNSPTDWLFVSVSANCPVIGGGCLKSFNITAGMPATFTARSPQKGGTSGIVIDNVSPVAQASSIYFSNEGNPPPACGAGPATGGCAVKLTQSGLQ